MRRFLAIMISILLMAVVAIVAVYMGQTMGQRVDAPAEETLVEETSTEETLAEEIPTEETLVEEISIEEDPIEESIEEEPIKALPTQEVSLPLCNAYGKELREGDPWMVEHEGVFYYMATDGNRLVVNSSTSIGDIANNRKIVWYTMDYAWAPELHYLDGRWFIYYSDKKSGSHDRNRRMYVLGSVTDDPQGGYECFGKLETGSDMAIDGTVVQLNGELYFFWSGDYGYQKIYIAHMSNPWTIDSERVEISRPEYGWEMAFANWKVNEGPQALVKDGVVHIVYSASLASSQHYCMGMLTFQGGNPLDPRSWVKSAEPVFQSGNGVYAPGHCSFVQTPDGEDWMVYHACTNASDACKWRRNIRLQPIAWEGTTPIFGEPLPTGTTVKVPVTTLT